MSEENVNAWREEFYPITAKEFRKTREGLSDDQIALDALKHSTNKWIGLLPKNLSKHKLATGAGSRTIFDMSKKDPEFVMVIDSSSCALCEVYTEYDYGCGNCPLAKFLGSSCDDENSGIYLKALKNPKIMVDALNDATKTYIKSIQAK